MKALVVQTNSIIFGKTSEEIRQDIIRQYRDGGIIVLDKGDVVREMEFDTVIINDNTTRKEDVDTG